MSESESTINPILPASGYTPRPSPASSDRDPDGPAIPGRANRRKRKRRRDKRPEPDVSDEKPEDSDGVPHVDIRAETFQIETWDRNDSEYSAVFWAEIELTRTSQLQGLAR